MTTPNGSFPWQAANATDGLSWYAGQGIGDWKARMAENMFRSFLSVGLFALREPMVEDIADAVVGPAKQLDGEIPDLRQVSTFLQGKWDLMDDISNVVGGIVDVFTAVLKTLGGDYSGLADLPKALLKRIEELAARIAGMFGLDGLIPASLLGLLPIGQLTSDAVNLALDGGFDAIPSGEETTGPGQWYHDPSTGHSSSGAACIEGDGRDHDLLGQPIAVAEGTQVSISAWIDWATPTWTADPARLVVIEFAGDAEVNRQVVAATTLDGTRWKQVTAQYVAPAGVDFVCLALTVTADLTGGRVWFDDVTVTKDGLIQQSWVDGLLSDWATLMAAFGAGDLTGIANAWRNLTSLFDIGNLTDLIGDPGSFDPGAVLSQFVQTMLWPLNLLGKLSDGKLIDAQAPQALWDTVDRIWNGWANLGDMIDLDRPGTDVLDAITGLLGIGLQAQSSIASAEARLRVLESEGNTQVDDFQRGSSSTLGGNWSLLDQSGGGSGSIGTDGSGNAVWKRSGSANRTLLYRHSGSVTTDSCVVRAVLASSPADSWPDDCFGYVCVSVSDTTEDYVRLRISSSDLLLQAVVSGAVHNLGTVSRSVAAGDTIAIARGLTGNTSMDHYVVSVNDQAVLTVDDTSSYASYGSTFRRMGLGMETSTRTTVWPPFLTQWQPISFAIITLSEVL